MVLDWTNPTTDIGSWNVTNYEVYLGQTLLTTITNGATTYTYDSSQQPCGANLVFKVVALLQNGSTNFTIESNTQSINIFRYADAPTSVLVNWATSNTDNTIVDILATFTVPSDYNHGCGSIITWVAQVYDSNDVIINSATKLIQYDPNTTSYLTYIDNIPFTPSGSVRVFLQTTDTNGRGTIDGAYASGAFISGGLPIFEDVVINADRTELTFNILSQTQLTKICRFLWFSDGSRYNEPFNTINIPPAPGLTIEKVILQNSVIKYSVTVLPVFFGLLSLPLDLVITAANQVGISSVNVYN
jgi:hypothetical protein